MGLIRSKWAALAAVAVLGVAGIQVESAAGALREEDRPLEAGHYRSRP